ncbi:Uncharacterised protein [Streptococcus pneumoniae]|nr:Uncharacterised protein [Streptococcus pneumoniae]
MPPNEPSIVLFGLISGHNFLFPNAFPTKYAPESVAHITNNAQNTYLIPKILVSFKYKNPIATYVVAINKNEALSKVNVFLERTVYDKSNRTITNVISNLPNPIQVNSSDALLGIKIIHNNTAAKTVGTEISVSLFIRINSYKPIEASAYTKTVKGTPP